MASFVARASGGETEVPPYMWPDKQVKSCMYIIICM